MKQGWELKKLGEIGKPSMCKRILKNQTLSTGEIPFYKIGTFGKTPDAFISKEIYDEFRIKYSFPKKGDILISASGTIGRRVRYDGEPAFFQDSNIVWIDNNEKQVLNDYLYVFYEFCDWQPSKGATISRLYNSNLTSIKIAFPKSLPEQQRIVAILNETFTAIAKAKANAEQNLKNAKELFESYLQGVFENKSVDWDEKTLGDIGKPSMCKRILKNQTSSTGDIPFYKIGTFGKKPNAFISKEIYNEFRTKYSFPKKGDILISASGTIGRRVRYDGEPAFFQDSNIVWIDNDESQVLNDYLYVFYEFCDWQPSKGATIARLYNSNLTSIKIVFPKSLEEQKNILKKINVLSSETKRLEAIYQKKINDLEELKKSVLQRAFSGELIEKK
jgi:type I restriction enzyme S subunit